MVVEEKFSSVKSLCLCACVSDNSSVECLCRTFIRSCYESSFLLSSLTIQNMYSYCIWICMCRHARIFARVGNFGLLYQQIGCGHFTFFRYYRHTAAWRIVVDFLHVFVGVCCVQVTMRKTRGTVIGTIELRMRRVEHVEKQIEQRSGKCVWMISSVFEWELSKWKAN